MNVGSSETSSTEPKVKMVTAYLNVCEQEISKADQQLKRIKNVKKRLNSKLEQVFSKATTELFEDSQAPKTTAAIAKTEPSSIEKSPSNQLDDKAPAKLILDTRVGQKISV